MKRRSFLTGGATAVAGLSVHPASSQTDAAPDGMPLAATELEVAATELRARFSDKFDPAYIDNAILPFFLVSVYRGERSMLPMIDVTLTKENALPTYLWGLISETWKPAPEKGVTVFSPRLGKARPRQPS